MTRLSTRVLAAGVAFLTLVSGGTLAVPGQAAAQSLRQRELAPSGAWSWFGDPRAVYHEGAHRRTYVGWVTASGSIQVASYDHDTQRRVVTTVKANFQIDDHANPSLLVRPDGRLLVFWSAHSGGTMYYRRSSQPEDVSGWDPEQTIPTNTSGTWGYTYPNPVQLTADGANGSRIWLFWRGGNFNPTFSTSGDAATWAPARTLISVPNQRPYLKVASDGIDEIHFAFTQAHPRNLVTNIYYARYQDGRLYHADGREIAPISAAPITPSRADLVYDAAANGNVKAWVHDVAIGTDGKPVIVFATFPSNGDHRYHYARFDGTRWVDREFAGAGGSMSVDPSEPNYSGGATLDHEDPSRVAVARKVNGVFEIQRWTTPDRGASWTTSTITSGSARGNYRPISPRGGTGPDLDLLWMRGGYPSYTRYQTAIDAQALSQDVTNPAAVDLAVRQLEVVAGDGTGGLIRKGFAGTWSGWQPAGPGPAGHGLGPPAVTTAAAGRLELFSVDQTTGHLLHRSRQGGTWTAWADRGAGPSGHPVAAPAAASWGSGRLDVVARDTVTNDLIHWWRPTSGAGWRGPERLRPGPGGAFTPSLTSWGAGRLDVFAITSQGRLAHAWYSGRWNGWESLGAGPGGSAYAAPAAATAWGSRRLDVFAATSGGRTLAHRWFDGTAWRGPETLAAGTGPDRLRLAGLTATSWASRRLDLFSTSAATRGLLHTWYDGRWHGPERLDFTGTTATIMADPNPRDAPIPIDPRIATLGDD